MSEFGPAVLPALLSLPISHSRPHPPPPVSLQSWKGEGRGGDTGTHITCTSREYQEPGLATYDTWAQILCPRSAMPCGCPWDPSSREQLRKTPVWYVVPSGDVLSTKAFWEARFVTRASLSFHGGVCVDTHAVCVCTLQPQASRTKPCSPLAPAQGAETHPGVCLCVPA